ncbi:hypothetical protein HJFPF1_12982 [Paramyrothecium foliicola]|nr:hypothetical protein HJFPF1_12982 [Paramyrothecium foliicola]
MHQDDYRLKAAFEASFDWVNVGVPEGVADSVSPASYDVTSSNLPRSLSRASSFGSADSGVSHPPRKSRPRKKTVHLTWEEFDVPTSDRDTQRQLAWVGAWQNDCNVSQTHDSHQRELIEDLTPNFACPFYKYSPTGHSACSDRRLSRVRDVKQHILRRHNYSCSAQETMPYYKTTKKQLEKLSRSRVNRAKSQVEQWYDIWDIIFENVPRPDNVFLAAS